MDYPPFAVTVDVVLMTVKDGHLFVLMQRRSAQPFEGEWALPGGFVGLDEDLDDAARRILVGKSGFKVADGAWLEQLHTFGHPDRDPRMRTVSIAYFALLPHSLLENAISTGDRLDLIRVDHLISDLATAAFDHVFIIRTAHDRLKDKIFDEPAVLFVLPELFTLRELQDAYEAILGTNLNKPAFRRRMLLKGWFESAGVQELQKRHRPAELYRKRGCLA